MIPIIEVFQSIQGEGYKVGLPTIFVRVSGCNFAMEKHPCSYCDTAYAWYHDMDVKSFTPAKILEDVKYACNVNGTKEVCLTGGEPLVYPDFVRHMITRWYNITIETNGSLPIWKSYECVWSVDIKCPSSGNSAYNRYENINELIERDQLKFVIGDKEDFEFARSVVLSHMILCNVIFQPVWKKLRASDLVRWVLDDKDLCGKVRIGMQAHKVIWPKRVKGV